MIHFGSEPLLGPRVFGRGKRAADIAANDFRFRSQFRQRPRHVVESEPAALPIRDRVVGPQTIEIDRDIQVRSSEGLRELGEFRPPIPAHNSSAPILIRRRPLVRPRMNLQLAGSLCAPIAEELPRPPALEISATPDTGFLEERQFQSAIDPAAAAPAWRTNVPIRMIIERDEDERFGEAPKPERAQMVKIAGAINEKRPEPRTELAKKFLD